MGPLSIQFLLGQLDWLVFSLIRLLFIIALAAFVRTSSHCGLILSVFMWLVLDRNGVIYTMSNRFIEHANELVLSRRICDSNDVGSLTFDFVHFAILSYQPPPSPITGSFRSLTV